ncbi:MAG: M20/M25/M40 family metallo-hydrolase, partial [Verrucomicrobia bacterium]|nr:M20/M25/M40 family metallo-hydrolase [Verrucomicrobiota bacterium]
FGDKLPVNVKILFEGEEEYGLDNILLLLRQEAEELNAHALIVMDGTNTDAHTGTLTTSTRGLVNLTVSIKALEKPQHSGSYCVAPDPAMALAYVINSLRYPRDIPGFMDDCEKMDPQERMLLRNASQTAEAFMKEAGVLQGTLRGDADTSIYERIVEEPSISIHNMNSGQPNGGNTIQDSASCTVGIRLTSGQIPKKVEEAVTKYIKELKDIPYGLSVDVKPDDDGCWGWKADLTKPYSQEYLNAMKDVFGKIAARPTGGTIPMLHECRQLLPDMEIIMPGVEDPECSAHSHNESQHKGLLLNSINSLIAFMNKVGSK